jgi:flagellar protein FliS
MGLDRETIMYGRRKTDRNPYRSNDVISRSPEGLVVLLYQQLLAELRRAHRQIEEDDVEGRSRSLSRCTSILFELMGSLNHEKGGELSGRLSALYSYVIREIQETDRTRDKQRLERLVELVTPLHDAWIQAAEMTASNPAIGSEGNVADVDTRAQK